MTATYTVCVKTIDGEQMLDPQGMALLFGVEADAVRAMPVKNGAMAIPREWIKRGRRRAKEVLAHTGSDAMLDSLHYWAAKDYGATLKVIYE